MALTDTMFIIEVIVEELKTFVYCSDFYIKGEFADVFSVYLKGAKILEQLSISSKHPRQLKTIRKVKGRKSANKLPTASSVQTGKTVLFGINVDTLISNMKQYPLELSLWRKDIISDFKIGSTQIPWSAPYFGYLNKLYTEQGHEPICVRGDYDIFEEATSKRIAIIKLNVKLRHFKDKITQSRSPSQVTQQTEINVDLNSKPVSVLSTVVKPNNFTEETGIIKTIYSGDKRRPIRANKKSIKKKETKSTDHVGIEKRVTEVETAEVYSTLNGRLNSGVIHLVRSETNWGKNLALTVIKSKSCSSIVQNRNLITLNNYIFGTGTGPFGNQIYCVSYFTVENDLADPSSPKTPSRNASEKSESSGKSQTSRNISGKTETPGKASGKAETPGKASGKTKTTGDASGKTETSETIPEEFEKEPDRYKFRLCKSDCLKFAPHSRKQSTCSLDITKKIVPIITVKKCSDVQCTFEKMRELPTPPDDGILIDLSYRRPDCCAQTEEVVAGMKAKMTFNNSHPCYCECECQFDFMKKTTFCNICGGYEKVGEDYGKVPGFELPFPCPIFHKINKMKLTSSKDGSDKKMTEKDSKSKHSASPSSSAGESTPKKGKKKKTDDRFKFNYGFTGIPALIGHSRCALPCVGTLGVVPKTMGWLWTCENVPGMKFRPTYKPGAVNKHVLKLLKIAKNSDEAFGKKRKKVPIKSKIPLKRPLLIVNKKDGEYTVTMETMKTATSTSSFQHPYEDKPVVTYTIGRTSEENLMRKLKKERAKRRLERLQRDFVQSAFRDMCQEICVKTYQQALELLPDAEKPDCTCLPALPGPDDVDVDHSCSCEEDKSLSESDTDSDEWIVEFTPPIVRFDSKLKSKKKIVTTDNTTQYTYMDYRVKLVDRFGNPVPRFFKGPDGKQECSDLGGFWSADRSWLEINVDGFIGPDGRWAPHNFLGPDDEVVDGETGKFQAMNGEWLVIGVDGYVDQGKWKNYCKAKSSQMKKKTDGGGGGGPKDKKTKETWNCFASVTPKQLSKMGIIGHGRDKKLLYSKLKDLKAHGENVNIPERSTVPQLNRPKGKRGNSRFRSIIDRVECKHAAPSDKGIESVDRFGNKKYFTKKEFDNRRAQDRVSLLAGQGFSVSTFHLRCYGSCIGTEAMKKQQYDRLVALAEHRGDGGQSTLAPANYTGKYVIK